MAGLDDLYEVGKTKSLGYLPISTIIDYGKTVDELLDYATGNVKSLILSANDCDIKSGALYFYDPPMLNDILQENQEILKKAGVPTEPIAYINYISNFNVNSNSNPEAFRIIGLTFNDARFRN